MDLNWRERIRERQRSSADPARASLLRRIPWRPGVYGFLAGVIASLLPVLFGEIVEMSAMLVLGTYGLVLGCVLRWWFARSARRAGRTGRLTRLLVAGTLLGSALFQGVSLLYWEPVTVAISTVADCLGLLIMGLLLGGVPALLVWAWSEKDGLRSRFPWWLLRGLASGILGFVLSCLAVLAIFQINFHVISLEWSEPLSWITGIAAEVPVVVLCVIGIPVLLALAVGIDQRRHVAGPRGPAAASAAPAANPTCEPAGPEILGAVPGLA